MPPHAQFMDFLDAATHQALLDWVSAQRGDFVEATVTKSKAGHGTRLDPRGEDCLKLGDLGPLEPMLSERLLAILPEAMAAVGSRGIGTAIAGAGAHRLWRRRPFQAAPGHPDRPGPQPAWRAQGRRSGDQRGLLFPQPAQGLFRRPAAPVPLRQRPGGAVLKRTALRSSRSTTACSSSRPGRSMESERVSCPSGEFRRLSATRVNCWYCRPLDAEASGR